MEKRKGGVIRDWCIYGRRLVGKIYNDEKYADGSTITTSEIVLLDVANSKLETKNTIYTLKEDGEK